MENKNCYAWNEKLGMCSLFEVWCDQKKDKDCFHKKPKEFKKLKEKRYENSMHW
jgi:hypothetical protein